MNYLSVIRLLRPKHWVKNLLIFAPLFFSGEWSTSGFITLIGIFISFSLMASTVYIVNDLTDVHDDRKHPKKKQRPLAAGEVTPKQALILACIFALAVISWLVLYAIEVAWFYALYFLINVLYSLYLKSVAVLDVAVVASGYIIRIFVGALVFSIEVSEWMIILTFLSALFLTFGKRKRQIRDGWDGITRRSLSGYNEKYLEMAQAILASIILIAYIMYTISPEVTDRVNSNLLYITSLPVILGFLRYFQLQYVFTSEEDPVALFFGDYFLVLLVAIWIGLLSVLIYVA